MNESKGFAQGGWQKGLPSFDISMALCSEKSFWTQAAKRSGDISLHVYLYIYIYTHIDFLLASVRSICANKYLLKKSFGLWRETWVSSSCSCSCSFSSPSPGPVLLHSSPFLSICLPSRFSLPPPPPPPPVCFFASSSVFFSSSSVFNPLSSHSSFFSPCLCQPSYASSSLAPAPFLSCLCHHPPPALVFLLLLLLLLLISCVSEKAVNIRGLATPFRFNCQPPSVNAFSKLGFKSSTRTNQKPPPKPPDKKHELVRRKNWIGIRNQERDKLGWKHLIKKTNRTIWICTFWARRLEDFRRTRELGGAKPSHINNGIYQHGRFLIAFAEFADASKAPKR